MFDCTLLFIFIFYFFWLTLCLDDDVFFFKVQKGKTKGKTALFIPAGNVVFSYISFIVCFQVIFLIVPLAVDVGV